MRPSHVYQCHNLSSTFTRGDLDSTLSARPVVASTRLALAHSSGSSHPPLLSFQRHPSHTMSSSCTSFSISSCTCLVLLFCHFREQSRASSLHLLLSSSVTASSTPACPLSTVPPLLGQLDVLMFLFVPFSRCCCSHQHERAFPLHPHSNLSRVGDRPCTCVDKSWSSFIRCGQSGHAQIRHCLSRSRHGHDLRHALHSRTNF